MTGQELSNIYAEIVKNSGEDAADAWIETLSNDEQIKLYEYWKQLGG